MQAVEALFVLGAGGGGVGHPWSQGDAVGVVLYESFAALIGGHAQRQEDLTVGVGADRGRDLLLERLDLRQQRLECLDEQSTSCRRALTSIAPTRPSGALRSFATSCAGFWAPEYPWRLRNACRRCSPSPRASEALG